MSWCSLGYFSGGKLAPEGSWGIPWGASWRPLEGLRALGRPWGDRGLPEGLLGELKGGQATARRGRNHKKVPERLRVEGLGDQMGPKEWGKEALREIIWEYNKMAFGWLGKSLQLQG